MTVIDFNIFVLRYLVGLPVCCFLTRVSVHSLYVIVSSNILYIYLYNIYDELKLISYFCDGRRHEHRNTNHNTQTRNIIIYYIKVLYKYVYIATEYDLSNIKIHIYNLTMKLKCLIIYNVSCFL